MVLGAFGILLVIVVALSLPSVRTSQILQKFEGQFRLIYENVDRLKLGRSIDYGTLREAYGAESLSGYWRLAHWTKAASMFLSAQFPVWFFGFGIGASGAEGEPAAQRLPATGIRAGDPGGWRRVPFFGNVSGKSTRVKYNCRGFSSP
jgi:hypothetical protein